MTNVPAEKALEEIVPAAESMPVSVVPAVKKVITWRGIALGAFLIVFVWVYFYLATHLIHGVNRDPGERGQEWSLRVAEEGLKAAVADSGAVSVNEVLWEYLPHYTDGVIAPLWPWIAGRFASEHQAVFFVRGKWFYVVMTAVFCCVLALWVSRVFTLAATLNLVCLAGFAVFLKRAVHFEPEPLYYVLFFLSWVCCILALRRNSTWLYAFLGVLLGLAYLTKASALPLLVIFVAVSTLHWLETLLLSKRRMRKGETGGRWAPQNHFMGLAFLAAGFLSVSGARLHYAAEALGSPWRSYPAQWMWMDSLEEGVEFMRKHSAKEGLEALPGEKAPSLGNYLATHSPEERRERVVQGTAIVAREFVRPQRTKRGGEGPVAWREVLPLRGYYLAALFIILCVVGCAFQIAKHSHPEEFSKAESRSARLVVSFLLVTALVYTVGYGWYARIEHADKFLLALYLPVAFSIIWGAESLLKSIRDEQARKALGRGYATIHLVLLGAICYRIAELVKEPTFNW